jgi:hypothetical protein
LFWWRRSIREVRVDRDGILVVDWFGSKYHRFCEIESISESDKRMGRRGYGPALRTWVTQLTIRSASGVTILTTQLISDYVDLKLMIEAETSQPIVNLDRRESSDPRPPAIRLYKRCPSCHGNATDLVSWFTRNHLLRAKCKSCGQVLKADTLTNLAFIGTMMAICVLFIVSTITNPQNVLGDATILVIVFAPLAIGLATAWLFGGYVVVRANSSDDRNGLRPHPRGKR